jgi:hypothetical protein
MGMREECKHFQSRTYDTGEVARLCILDLAPEAPWRCPDDCGSYARRLADATWDHGSLVAPAVEAEPDEPTGDMVELLREAEEVVDEVLPEALEEARAREAKAEREALKQARSKRGPLRRFRRS